MTHPDPAAGRTEPPWTADGTVYFWRGPLSNFAPTPGLRLPVGYHGHHEREHVTVPTVEHWFQACKATAANSSTGSSPAPRRPRPSAPGVRPSRAQTGSR